MCPNPVYHLRFFAHARESSSAAMAFSAVSAAAFAFLLRLGHRSRVMQGMPDPQLVAAVETYFGAIRERDQARWLQAFDDDAACHDPVGTAPAEGGDGLREVWRVLTAPFTKLLIAETAAFYCGSGAAVHWQARGTGVNGRTITFEGISVFEFSPEGKIQTLMAYWDPAAMMIELAGEGGV
jgi:steroid Delta-isomerase